MTLYSFSFFVLMTFTTGIISAQESSLTKIGKPTLAQKSQAGFEAFLSRGYSPLFNGKDLSGWHNPYPHGKAKVVDGEIHLIANDKFFLVTENKYSDFRLSVDIYLPEGKANSGVMFRCQVDPDAKKKKVYGYQAECDGSDRCWSGGLYDEGRRGWIWPSTEGRSQPQFLEHAEESKAAFAAPIIAKALNRNGWNRFVITAVEDFITIEVNGVPTTSFRDTVDTSGYIAIQHHGEDGQTYRFRNLFIKELPENPAETTVSLTEQPPVSVKRIDDNVILVDFGKVAFGNLMTRVPETGRGWASFHFGEKLKDGRIDRTPPGTVRYGETQIRKDVGVKGNWVIPTPVDYRNTEQAGNKRAHPPAVLTSKAWRPVMPFRWVEIEGWEGEFKPEYIKRRAARQKMRKRSRLEPNLRKPHSRKPCLTTPPEFTETESEPITAAFTPTSSRWRSDWYQATNLPAWSLGSKNETCNVVPMRLNTSWKVCLITAATKKRCP